MESMNFPVNTNGCVLALGPESDGNFSVFRRGMIHRSDSFGDLLSEENFQKFTRTVAKFLKNNQVRPDIVLTDLHPFYRTTVLGENLSKKYKAKHVKIQHHMAHVFSAIGDRLIGSENYKLKATSYGLACDGTGYGLDGKIWGGEIFKVKSLKLKVKSIERIGHLENQILIGGDLAMKEPARMLISILGKFMSKDKLYQFVKKYYSRNQFELLYNQFGQNFNCQETSSTGRILDAVSVLLGFSGNKRKYKHGPAIALENNSTVPYNNLIPVVARSEILDPKSEKNSKLKTQNSKFFLKTTPIFEYLVKNINGNKHRLAATVQLYIADGLYEIIRKCHPELDSGSNKKLDSGSEAGMTNQNVFFAGGIASNKIIASYLERKGIYASKKIPRGDAGISFGQIIYYLLTDPRN